MIAWRAALLQRERLFSLYIESFSSHISEDLICLLDRAFPNEAELNVLQSGVKQVGRAELLAKDQSFLQQLLAFIGETNYMKLLCLPDDLREAVQVLMCERTYLVQLVKGLIEKLIPASVN